MPTTIKEEELEYTPSGALDHVLQNVLMVDPKKSDLARILRGESILSVDDLIELQEKDVNSLSYLGSKIPTGQSRKLKNLIEWYYSDMAKDITSWY